MRRATRPGSGAAVAVTILLLMGYIRLAASQAVDPDKINFATMSQWKDLRDCVRCQLQSCYGNIADYEGCATNGCICRGSTLGDAIPKLRGDTLSYCSNLDDASTAVSVLTAYCASKGYTQVVQPTILQTTTTGAYTVTITQAAVTVTQTRTANAAAGAAPKVLRSGGPVPPYLVATLAAVIATFAAPFLWLQSRART
ncbi:hypothetical protein B0T19DRAFT_420492 [Cercophora scortea]|uniref:Extracellular membrane protein CFEM domain-containing protein n=1 Tax=Cercophora scortea TaxID=314031 RepID=A0AAE0MC33_9PEZI|nr:hypothetical protein B0T19DRAFT_420492 [Cercophora scortea]